VIEHAPQNKAGKHLCKRLELERTGSAETGAS